MKITINNLQKTTKPNLKLIREFSRLVCLKALKTSKLMKTGISDLSVTLTGSSEIRKLNLQYFKKDSITDVITQCYRAIPGNDFLMGDIFVNIEEAFHSNHASIRQWSPSRELALYIAHGIDHLLGGKDDTIRGRNAMRRRELRWLSDRVIKQYSTRLLRP